MDDVRAVLDAVGSSSAVALRLARRLLDGGALRGDLPGADAGARALPSGARTSPDYGQTEDGAARARGAPRALGNAGVLRRAPRRGRARRSTRTTEERELVRRTALRARREPGRRAMRSNRAWFETDLRDVLPAVRVPTLVLYRAVASERCPRRGAADPGRSASFASSGDDYAEIFLLAGDPRRDRALRRRRSPAPDVPDTRARDGALHRHRRLDRARRRARRPRAGASCSSVTTRSCGASSTRFRGEEMDTAGDGFFATFDGPARAIRCAQAIVDGVRRARPRVRGGRPYRRVRAARRQGRGAGGGRSARASRRSPSGGEVLVSQTVKDLVAGAGVEFEERGEHELKGVPGTWRLYAVADVSAHGRGPQPLLDLAPAMSPQTRYAKSGDVNIAYQVVGDGPLDLVFVPGLGLERRADVGGARARPLAAAGWRRSRA